MSQYLPEKLPRHSHIKFSSLLGILIISLHAPPLRQGFGFLQGSQTPQDFLQKSWNDPFVFFAQFDKGARRNELPQKPVESRLQLNSSHLSPGRYSASGFQSFGNVSSQPGLPPTQ